ncbi:MAG TPA: hypothetical protein VE932_05025 [Patescibacteria group bacterium]|nr:hypothetical protein [Patescibacteria group bacterium]
MNTKRRSRRKQPSAITEAFAAQRRVGLGDARLRWLVDFARRREDDASRQLRDDSLSTRWEAFAFAFARVLEVAEDTPPPTSAEITAAHRALWADVLGALQLARPIEGARWVGTLLPQSDGTVKAVTDTSGLPFEEAFMVQAYEALRAAHRARLRFCPVCHRPFMSKRPDAKVCPTGSCRTLAWRRRHPERFRQARRDAYRRGVVNKTGNRNVRIQRRTRGDSNG